MKRSFTFLFLLLSSLALLAQNHFIVNAGAKLNDVIPAKDQFKYSEFLNGKVFFKDGTITEGKFNYNCLTDEMLFLSHRGDTLALDKEPTIKFIAIINDTFFFDQGYILLVKSDGILKLGIKVGFKLVDKRKETAYESSNSTSSIASMSAYNDGKLQHNLRVNEQNILVKVTHYYFGDKYDHFVLATKKNLIDLFPNFSNQINRFCKENRIHFDKRDDLEEVINFISGISYGLQRFHSSIAFHNKSLYLNLH